jgi:drug/metabolite transporter (DMT)-like permease
MTENQEREITPGGLFHLVIVYLVWGSTYLAIRVGVREGSGFPPFTFGALRVVTAGFLLLLWCRLRGGSWKLGRRDLITLLSSGLLLWIGGNGLVLWAEQKLDSGLTALILSSVPIWVAVLDALIDLRFPSWRVILSLLIGFSGILILSYPVFQSGIRADMESITAVVLASLFWSGGLVIQNRRPPRVNLQISSGYQQLFGGIAFTLLAVIFQEPRPAPDSSAWLAFGYLLIFGSLIAFTSFVTILQVLPVRVATTYAYVNPVIAVALGWLLLGEPITPWTVGGAALVLIGVAGVFRARRKKVRTGT